MFDKPKEDPKGLTFEIRVTANFSDTRILQAILDYLQQFRPNTPPLQVAKNYDNDQWFEEFVEDFSVLKVFVPDAKTDGRIKLFIPIKEINWGNTTTPRADGIGPDLSEHP